MFIIKIYVYNNNMLQYVYNNNNNNTFIIKIIILIANLHFTLLFVLLYSLGLDPNLLSSLKLQSS